MKNYARDVAVRCLLVLVVACLGAMCAHAQSSTVSNPAPATVKIDLGDGVTMEFVRIQPGSFMMGSEDGKDDERPVHKVTIAKPFYMGKYEVTQGQWQMVMGTNPAKHYGSKNPVDQVSWEDCTKFVAALEKKVPGHKFSLPSEAQWEYACRAGSTTTYCYGNDKDALLNYAWYHTGTSHAVGQLQPNAWGLYDMHGNVWEWCQDNYHQNYDDAPTDGSAWAVSSQGKRTARDRRLRGEASADDQSGGSGWEAYRIQRGGGYASYAASVTSSHRSKDSPYERNRHYGLRLVMAAETP